MMIIAGVVLAVLLGLAYVRARLAVWSVALVIAVAAISYAFCAPYGLVLGLTGVTIVLALLLNLRPL